MFLRIARRPATLPALLFSSLLLISNASAQDKKPEQGQPPQRVFNVGGGDAGPNGDPDGPFKQSEVTKRAVLTFKAEPGFTEEARKNNVDGVVRLRAVLNKSGEVTNISVVKGLPDGLTERAIAAARQIKFRPAEKDGRPVSQYVVLEYNFNIFEDEDRLSRKARITRQPRAEYTDEARGRKVEGKVVLNVVLYKDGTAEAVNVFEGLPYGLTEKAQEAARKIQFKPAEDEGHPVNVIRRVEYVFKLP